MRAIIETVFDIFYLVTVLTVGIRMIRGSKAGTQFRLFGLMAVVLGAGDSFHLVPRALALCTTGLESYAVPLGLGKWITSVTMTVFYVLLYYVWRKRYQIEGQKNVTAAVYALSAVRIVLCMMPQNQWLTNHTPLEKQTLPWGAKLMTMECGTRFLADYLEGDHYFHINYETQNLNRARTQFKLTADMERNWDAMQKVIEKYC